MRVFKYISLLFLTIFALGSCEKQPVEFDAELTNSAEFQLHYFEPVTPGVSSKYMYEVRVNGRLVANAINPLNSYNGLPSTVGRFFTAAPGEVNLKLYQGTDMKLVYDRNVPLKAGKQNVVIHDLNDLPLVFDTGYPFINERKSYYTDSVAFVKFYNLLYETPEKPTNLTLQYQYQYTLHPIYTEDDRDKGLIPDGKKLGDATGDGTKSDWINLGPPVAFGETTGWQEVPVKKSSFLAQGSARIDFRIRVTEGEEIDKTKNDEGRLLACPAGSTISTAYSDYWTLNIGRRSHHFFSGVRSGTPGSAVRNFFAH